MSRSRALPGLVGEIDELWAADKNLERPPAEAAVRWLPERGAGAIFHTEDAAHPERELWKSLRFDADVIRFSLHR